MPNSPDEDASKSKGLLDKGPAARKFRRFIGRFLRGSSFQGRSAIACGYGCGNGGEGSCTGVGGILLFSSTVWARSWGGRRGTHTGTHRNVHANVAPTL